MFNIRIESSNPTIRKWRGHITMRINRFYRLALQFGKILQIPDWDDEYDQDVAIMFMSIWQPSLTHTIRKEVDPLEWGEILGNIGGTWGK